MGRISKAPAPGWVDELAVPQPREARLRQAEDGVYYLIEDMQTRPDKDLTVSYYRNATKVMDRSGLESAARLDVEFDPSYEDIVVHRLRLLRAGQVLDRLDATDIGLLRRETGLDDGVMDGLRTAHMEIADVRVGDVVDIAYSRVSKSTLWPEQFSHNVPLEWSVPLMIDRYRLLWPSGRPLTIRNRAIEIAPKLSPLGDRTLYEWRRDDPDPVAAESGTPDWFTDFGRVSLSDATSWKQVIERVRPLYETKTALPAELVARVERIEARYKRPEDRITEVLRMVQDELRYVSLSMGAGSYAPRAPAEVLRSGFGDCKDKAQLVVALLGRMGIEAHVALTDSKVGPSLPEFAPQPYVFDHAIVEVKLGGRIFWVEPTRSHEGGRFPKLAGLSYGWALPLAAGQEGLEKVPPPADAAPAETTTERYVVSPDGALTLHVATYYRNEDADWMRGNLVSKSPAQIEADYLKYYAGFYPGLVSAQPIRFTDDRDANRVGVFESYTLSRDKLDRNALASKFPVSASSLTDYNDVPQDGRRTPYGLSFPTNKQQTIILVTPGRQPPAPGDVAIDGPAFKYGLDVTREGDTLTLRYALFGKARSLAPGQVAQFRKDVAALKDANYWELDLTAEPAGLTLAEPVRLNANIVWPLALLLIALIAAYGLMLGLREDGAPDSVMYPVDRTKFLAMSAATAGLYTVFWAWKCWRWLERRDMRGIAPFWRAMFSLFWLHPLFEAANKRSSPPAVSNLAGGVAAILYLVFVPATTLAGMIFPGTHIAVFQALLTGVFFLPALGAVNALNPADGAAMRANSKVTALTLIALCVGVLNWALILSPPDAAQLAGLMK